MSPPRTQIDKERGEFNAWSVRRSACLLLGLGLGVLAACREPAPSLSEVTEPVRVIVPSGSTDMGTHQVGTSSSPKSVRVDPDIGFSNYDQVTAVSENCPDFSVDAQNLPAPVSRECEYMDPCYPTYACLASAPCQTTFIESYTFSVIYTPVVAQTTNCVVTVSTANGETHTVTFTGTGTPPPGPDIDAQPASIAFGDVRRGSSSSPAAITIRNLGGTALNVTGISASAGFSVAPADAYSVAPGGTTTHQVTCNPSALGGMSGTVTFTSNDPATGSITVALSCNGIDSNLELIPSPAAFPTTRVGEPVNRIVQIKNSGAAAMTLQSVAVNGTEMTIVNAPAGGAVVAPGEIVNAEIRFGATAPGATSGMLTVTFDGGQTRTGPVTAQALPTSMAVNPDGIVDLGPVCIGQTRQQSFSILANEAGSFRVMDITQPVSPFTLNKPALPAMVQGGGASTFAFDVSAAPTVTGASTATIDVATDIPGGTPRTVQLSVEGLTAGVTATPSQMDFGSSPLNVTTAGQMVTVTNCNATDVPLMNPRREGPDADEFAIVLHPSSTLLRPMQSVGWLVIAQPHSPGQKSATFAVDHPGGTLTVNLSTEGLSEDILNPPDPIDPSGNPDPSYYACSTSSAPPAASLALIAIAIAVSLRRRRAR